MTTPDKYKRVKLPDQKHSRSVSTRDVHVFLWGKRNSRDLLKCDQKALAIEFKVEQTKFHRLVNKLLAEGKLKVVAIAAAGVKTFKISEPVDDVT